MKTHRKNYLSQIVLTLIFSCLCISNAWSQEEPVIDFFATETSICPGTEVAIYLGPLIPYQANYYWDFGYGASPSSSTGSETHIVTYSSPGTKTVTLTVEIPELETYTTVTKKDFITVHDDNNTITLSSAAFTVNQAVCENAPLAEINYNIGGWPGFGLVSNVPPGVNVLGDYGITTISGNPMYAGIYNYEVHANGLCGSGTVAYGSITVYPTPIISDEKTDWTNTTVCLGSSKQLTFTGTPATVDPWLSSNLAVATVDNNGIVTGISPGTSIITYKDSYGCSNTSTLTVKPLPAAPLVQFNNLVQAGGRMFLCAYPEDYYTSYTWTGPANFTSTQSCPHDFGEATEEMQGIYRVTATVDGCTGPAATADVVVNYPPVITEGESVEVTCDEDNNPDPFSLNVTDADGDPILWSFSVTPYSGLASMSGTGLSRVIHYTPFPNFYGYDSFEIMVSDGSGGTDHIAVNVKVNPVNDPPVVAAPLNDQVLDEFFGTRVIDLTGLFSDPDSYPLTLSAVSSNESVVSVSLIGTNLTLTEAGLGECIITVTANDGHLTTDDVFSVTVNKVQASLATISTSGISSITIISAHCGGNVTSDGGAPVTARGVCWSTNPGPTVDGIENTMDGSGTGTYSSLVTGLSAGTTYYLRSYATNSSGTAYGNEIVFKTYSPDAIADIDGNYYTTVTIGSQVWMSENLKTTSYNDGTAIPLISEMAEWVNLTTPGYCWYVNDEGNAIRNYGPLYNWYVVDETGNSGKNVCPTGWFVPGNGEWNILINYLGGEAIAGGKLKEAGTSHWSAPNSGATNESGFNGLPGGAFAQGHFMGIGESGYWWLPGDYNTYGGNGYCLIFNDQKVEERMWTKWYGFSVRCMQNTFPIVSPPELISTTNNTAYFNGTINGSGGSSVIAKGFCWSTSENPTVDLSTKTSDGSGMDPFNSSITGLKDGTLYHVRAYATNSSGTDYGEDITFTTVKNDYQILLQSGDLQSYGGGGMPLPMIFKIFNLTDNLYVTNLEEENLTLNATALTGYQDIGFNNKNDYCVNGDSSCFGGSYYVEPNTGEPYTLTITVTLKRDNQDIAFVTFNENITSSIALPIVTTNSISGITTTSAISGGNIVTDGGGTITERGICWATTTNPTITNSVTVNGTGTGSFTSNLSGLLPGSIYFVRAYAINSAGTAYGNEISFKTYNNDATQDIDGNYYNTVTIGSQVWMTENLKTTRYNDGTAIPLVIDNTEWGALTTPGYCWYNNDEVTYKDQYGALYNWYVVDAESNGGKNACPAGWYVPNDADWSTLTTYLGDESVAGGKMKETGITHWPGPNLDATNESGFTALPGGARQLNGVSDFIGHDGHWWSSSGFDTQNAWLRYVTINWSGVARINTNKDYGLSIRCIMGEAQSLPVLTTTAASSITQTTATIGGSITSDGGAPVTVRGVCWSTSPNPTVELDSKTMDATGNGNFTSSITELTAGTTYHVRAYATNSVGTGYGEDIVFTTLKVYQLEYISGNNQTYNGAGTPLPMVFKIKNVTNDLYVTNLAAENLSITATSLTGYQEAEFNNSNDYCGNGDYGCYGGYYYVDPNTGAPYTLTISVTLKSDNQELSVFTITENITGAIVLPAVTTNSISGITTSSAISGGNIITEGGGAITERGICWATTSYPTINDSKTVSGAGTGSYISNLSGLIDGTTYFARAYATNSAGTAYGNEISFKTYNNDATQDIDGNYYNTVTIGSQVWMTENLKTTRFNDGSNITLADPASSLENITEPVYCWYENNPDVYKETYGALYNWYAANSNKICPAGWHVPSDAEWTTLTDYLGGLDIAGSKLKEVGNNHWVIGNSDATNISGFTALPGGNRQDAYYSMGMAGYWWTSSEGDLAYTGWHRNMGNWDGKVGRYYSNKYFAWSVRCLQGEAATLPVLTTFAGSGIKQTLATAGGTITSDGGAPVTVRGVCWSTSTNPTIDLNTKTQDGSGIGSFTSILSGLSSGTLYYIRAYATNSTGTAYGNEFSFKTYNSDAIIDYDGNYYNIVTIGSQVWMAENLKTTHYNDGTPVPLITDNTTWANSAAPGYCLYNNDQATNKDIYGALYNWYIVDALSNGSKNVCPAGWSVPTDSEWSTLITFLGGEGVAGGKLKEAGTAHWQSPNAEATNESNFTALPAGSRGSGGTFTEASYSAFWWSSGESGTNTAWNREVGSSGGFAFKGDFVKTFGFSIRCLKSNAPSNTHFVPVWWPGNGMDHMNLYALTATLDNVALQPGDEIGIFDGDICVGMGVLTSELTGSNYLECTVSRDDPDTPVKDGYTSGNTVTFKVWDYSTGAEVSNVQAVYVSGAGIYTPGATATFNLSAITSVAQSTNLISGWNILSFAVKPDNMSMKAIVSPLISAGILIKVQDEKGNAIERLPDPIGWVDNIGQMSLSEGYKIKVSANTPFNFSGQPLSTLLNVSLDAGWNIMGYPFMSSQPALAAFQPLIDAGSLLKVQNEQGNAIEKLPAPFGWIDNIHNLLPGKGYKVKTTINTSLAINNAGKGDFQSYEAASIRSAHFKPVFPGNGLDQMNIYLKNPTLEGVGLKAGDEIGVFDGSRCVGAIIVADTSQGYISVIVSSDDPTTQEKDGFTDGDAFDLRLWDNQAGLEFKAKNTEPQKGFSNVFEKSATSVIKVDFEKESFNVLGDAFPNPSNDKTTFTFQLATESQVQLGIFNINGSLIKLLFDQKMPAGTHRIEWDNRAANGTKASSGIYFYRLKLNNFLQTKQLVIR